MYVVELVAAAVVLVGTVAVGTVVHELAHAVVLRVAGVPHELSWFPEADSKGLTAGIRGQWASVTPRADAERISPASLRVAAMAPLALLVPYAFVSLTAYQPTATGNPALTAATIGWLACALPSPQDFALLWYAEDALADA